MELNSQTYCGNLFNSRHVLWLFLFSVLVTAQTSNDTSPSSITNSTQQNMTVNPPLWLNFQSTELDRFMADHYNYYITQKGNKVWSCAMDLAWNQLKRSFLIGQSATFKQTNTLQKKIIDNYNSQKFTRDQISDHSYYIGSGYGTYAQNKINLQLNQKFPNKKFPQLKYDLKDQDIIIYSYFQKAFQFKTPFSQCSNFKFKGVPVDCFQSLTKKQRKQLYYKYYNNQNDFLMGIQTSNQNDEILLLKTNLTQFQNISIEKLLKWIEMYNKLPNKRLSYIDQFKMPVLNFDFIRQNNQMDNLIFTNPPIKQNIIKVMQQRLKFKMNRFGVQMTNDAVIVIFGISFFLDTKYFYLNKDFWLIFKEKNKKPYLIMNIKAVNQTWVSL